MSRDCEVGDDLRRASWWALLALLTGAPVGVGWWLLAPGGRRAAAGDFVVILEAPARQDVWLAVLGAVAGGLLALAHVSRLPDRPGRRPGLGVAGLVAGCVGGSLLALGTGYLLDAAVATPAAPSRDLPPVTALALHSPAALVVWPFVAAVVVTVDTARDLLAGRLMPSRAR